MSNNLYVKTVLEDKTIMLTPLDVFAEQIGVEIVMDGEKVKQKVQELSAEPKPGKKRGRPKKIQ